MSNLDLTRTGGLSTGQLDAYWVPYTGNRQFRHGPRIIVSAVGCYYKAADGRDDRHGRDLPDLHGTGWSRLAVR